VAVFWVALLMAVVLYICAIILVRTIGHLPEEDPDHHFFLVRFGSIKQAVLSLFQLAVQPNMMEYQNRLDARPLFAMFLVVFIIFGSFGMLALLTGVISEAMFEKNILRLEDQRTERERLRRLLAHACMDMFDDIEHNEQGEAQREVLLRLLPRIALMFDEHNVPYTRHDLVCMIDLMDTDASGSVNRTEFCRGVLQLAEEVRPMLIMELHNDSMTYFKAKTGDLMDMVDRLSVRQEEVFEKCDNTLELKELVEMGFQEVRDQLAHLQQQHGGAGAQARPIASRPSSRQPLGVGSNLEPLAHGGELERLENLVRGLKGDVCELQGNVFSLGGRMEELVSDAQSERIAAQLAELAAQRRCLEVELGIPAGGANRGGDSDRGGAFGGGVAAAMTALKGDIQGLQGTIFSLGSRVEELVSDSQSERLQGQLGELAVYRRRAEQDSMMASRVGECEFHMKQTVGVVKSLEDQTRELVSQMRSLAEHTRGSSKMSACTTNSPSLSRSHSRDVSDDRSMPGSRTPPALERPYLTRNGSRTEQEPLPTGPPTSATLHRSGSRGEERLRRPEYIRSSSRGSRGSHSELPVVSESGSKGSHE